MRCACGSTAGPTVRSSPSRSPRWHRASDSSASSPPWVTCPRSSATSRRGLDRRQGGAVGDEPRRRPRGHPPGLARRACPSSGCADRLGRRRVILRRDDRRPGAHVVAAAASPGYWWFVVIFALGRPLLSATNALAEVMAAEETGVDGPGGGRRARSRPATASGPGSPPSCTAWRRGRSGSEASSPWPSCRCAVVYAVRGWVEEPNRFMVAEVAADHPTPVLGAVGPALPPAGRSSWPLIALRHLGHHRPGQQLRLPVRPGRPAPAGYGSPRSWWSRRASPACWGCWPGGGWPTTSVGGRRAAVASSPSR